MSIVMLGIDHNRASVDIRAKFSFTKAGATQAMEQLKATEGILGCVILSTCNRMECYISTVDDWRGSLFEELCRLKQVEPGEYRAYFRERKDESAVDHLFHLTCGLKSQILGEDQILTQVKDALSLARDGYATDGVLEVLFRMAVTAGKRIKTEVVFSRANYTAMDSAIAMLKDRGIDLTGMTCMVIGNGEMGKLAAQSLKEQGAEVTVTIRQYRSGVVNIPAGCERINYADRYHFLPKCDIVASATSSPNFTLTAEEMKQIVFKKGLIMVDLAVPRDIEPEIGGMGDLELYDIDSFKNNTSFSQNKEAYAQAEAILQDKMQEFYDWLEGRDIIPRIKDIQDKAVEDFNLRIHKILMKLPMEQEEKDRLLKNIDTAAGKVVGKMLYGMRDSLPKENFLESVESMEKIYGK